ncbi:MAG: hypothetical protein GQ544_09910 [Candidatus Aminicenantes bacterium]|nr:hypothetical protein [Candidatus Aminicenantes bacterium]
MKKPLALPRLLLPLAVLLTFCFLAGCSHVKPYYRDSIQPDRYPIPEEDQISFRVLLIGDAGAPREDEPTFLKITQWASRHPEKTMIIFLGDNIYPDSMPETEDPWRIEAERRLKAQTDVIKKSGAQGFFIAGNHDWKRGLEGMLRQEKFIHYQLGSKGTYLPPAGCPGPEYIDLPDIRIIAVDSHYWLHPDEERLEKCSQHELTDAEDSLKAMLQSAGDRHVIMVSHHSLDSYGTHGGFFDWKDHLFPLRHIKSWMWLPLPIVGSLYPLLRWNVAKHPQELNSPEYKNMIRQFKEAFQIKKPLLYVGGHDHSLQVFEGEDMVGYILVSGAGIDSKLSTVGHRDSTLFAHLHAGFMSVDFKKDGSVWLYVVEPMEPEIVFSYKLETK